MINEVDLSKDLISKSKLYDEAVRLSGPFTGDGWDNWGVYNLIMRQPPVSAVPVVHGRWEDGAFENSKRCSVCKRYSSKVYSHSDPIFDYERCPYCGAYNELL